MYTLFGSFWDQISLPLSSRAVSSVSVPLDLILWPHHHHQISHQQRLLPTYQTYPESSYLQSRLVWSSTWPIKAARAPNKKMQSTNLGDLSRQKGSLKPMPENLYSLSLPLYSCRLFISVCILRLARYLCSVGCIMISAAAMLTSGFGISISVSRISYTTWGVWKSLLELKGLWNWRGMLGLSWSV